MMEMQVLIKVSGKESIAVASESRYNRARAHLAIPRANHAAQSAWHKMRAMCSQFVSDGEWGGGEWRLFNVDVEVSHNGTILQQNVMVVNDAGEEKVVLLCMTCRERYYRSQQKCQRKEQALKKEELLAQREREKLERWLLGQ